MATVPRLAQGLIAVPVLLLVLVAGCVTTETTVSKSEPPPKPGVACQVVVTWQNTVVFAADPVHGGTPAPGFAGRVYLFGQEIDFPLVADGNLVFDLIDETTETPRWVERWHFDPETVKRLVRKDVIGWGYTVFLPSKEVKPGMSKIRLRTAFQAGNRAPVYTDSVVTLAQENGVLRKGTPTPFHLPGSRMPANNAIPPRAENAGPTLPPPTPVR